jgi:predicted house-cleaning noncanonical NTP pyrophosphatase (MazG superfamily)
MGKLVRDRIPEAMRKLGKDPVVRVLAADDYRAALLAKLDEESAELKAAPEGELVEEMADVLEVLRAIEAHHDIAWSAVEETGDRKRRDRGAFADRLYLE